MKKSLSMILAATVVIVSSTGAALAAPDQYLGDAAIYSGNVVGAKPNVLFVIDNSAGSGQPGATQAYNPTKTYPGSYPTNEVYVRQAATKGTYNYNDLKISVSQVTCAAAHTQLTNTGAYYGPLTNKGDCGNSKTQSGNYYTGNLLNYLNSPTPSWQANTAYNVDDVVVPPGGGNSYVCVQAGTSGSSQPAWPTTTATTVTDGTTQWILRPATIISMVQQAVAQVAAAARDSVNVGLAVFGNNNHGAQILQPVLDISDSSTAGPANYANFINSLSCSNLNGQVINGMNISCNNVNGVTPLLSSNVQLVNEALWDAGQYFRGQTKGYLNNSCLADIPNNEAGSPVTATCQKNFIVVLTTGNSDSNSQTKQYLTDLNGNGEAGDVADAAIYNYTTANPSLAGAQGIQTTVIQLLSVAVPLLQQAAADSHGEYYNVWNTTQMTQALYDAMTNIVLQVNTSFVAPVVPVSPENRSYSGSMVYMGLFKPISQSYWHGNLKKYGLSTLTATSGIYNGMTFTNVVTDKNGNQATYVDNNVDGYDDIDGTSLPSNTSNGAFRANATSFWSSSADGGNVESGGVGSVLLSRNFSTNPRKIYTFTGASTALTAASNAFCNADVASTLNCTANPAITPSLLGLSSTTDADNLINFIYGLDPYDENSNGITSEKRAWIMGDVLHSKPLVVNYNTSTTLIFVGSNDGMLHAFNDSDGSEAWAFIPPDMLQNLQDIPGQTHTYFADSSPVAYIYSSSGSGTINAANGDKAILIFGERRGGGASSAPTSGTYYALDVSNPTSPVFLWSFNNSSVTGGTTTTASSKFSELAESWSEPNIVRMNIGGISKIVALIGAGYDNGNEDSRYGATLTFSGSGTVTPTDVGYGAVTSTGTGNPSNPRGRGIYAVELATLDSSGVPTVDTSVNKIWGYTNANNANMTFSFPGNISALDLNSDGFVDRLYAGDTGGNIWRLDVSSSDTNQWTATEIFSSNPGYTNGTSDSSTGRKIFYKPSITVQSSNLVMLFFGTGDREHPLNWNVTDRFYGLKDSGQTGPVTEKSMTDVTLDQLQTATDTSTISNTLSQLNSTYGWYIRLDQNSGEKVLAAPTVFNKVAYFTTYSPNTAAVPDPCQAGNLGTARLYAVNYLTGEAVLDYDTSNDKTSTTNLRATPVTGQVLLRSDRVMTIGSGIPSGIVLLINPNGATRAVVGVGGSIPTEKPAPGGTIIPLYWRQR